MNETTMKHYIIEMVNETNDMTILKKIYTFVHCWLKEE